MKRILPLIICFFLTKNTFAQFAMMSNFDNGFEKSKKIQRRNKAITVNAIAFGTLYSFGGLTFDTRFMKNQTNGLGYTIGLDNIINRDFVFYDYNWDNFSEFRFKKAIGIPVSLNYLIGTKKHHLELGAELFPMIKMGYETREITGDFVTKKATKLNVYPLINIGYRYQALQKGFVCSALLKPIYFEGSFGVAFSMGLGYGF